MLACGDEDDSSTRCGAIVIFVVSDTLNIKLSSVIKRMLGNAVEITLYHLYLIIICTGTFSFSCYTLRNYKPIPEIPAEQTCVN